MITSRFSDHEQSTFIRESLSQPSYRRLTMCIQEHDQPAVPQEPLIQIANDANISCANMPNAE